MRNPLDQECLWFCVLPGEAQDSRMELPGLFLHGLLLWAGSPWQDLGLDVGPFIPPPLLFLLLPHPFP